MIEVKINYPYNPYYHNKVAKIIKIEYREPNRLFYRLESQEVNLCSCLWEEHEIIYLNNTMQYLYGN